MIFIAGATGFIGGHLVDHLLRKGLRPKCLVRSDRAGARLEAAGAEIVTGDITDSPSLRGVVSAGDFVVHLVGIIEEKDGITFERVHVRGTGNLLEEAVRAGAGHFLYQSALGADRTSWSGYLRTKAEAEDMVLRSGLPSTIFRPSLVVGPWDGFTVRVLDLLKRSPLLPIPGDGKALFQPVYVEDWLKCFDAVMDSPSSFTGVFDIGGPEHLSYVEIVKAVAQAAGLVRPAVNIPMGVMKPAASLLGAVLKSPPVTRDQLRLLESDNITRVDSVSKSFGFSPIKLAEALGEFLKKNKKS